MKKIILSAALFILIINPALAEMPSNSKNFAGPAISIGLSSVGTNSKFHHDKSNENTDYSIGHNQFVGVVTASYLKDIANDWLIGGGISYDLQPLKNKSVHYYSNAIGQYETTIKARNHFSVYVQPTYALNQSTSLFLKASYHKTKVNIDDDYFYGISDYRKTLNGIGLGIGTMIFLNKNIFTKFEIEYVSYAKTAIPYNSSSSIIDYKLTTTSGTFNIGYRF
jgi:opacity protein-like surface antigen